MNVISRAPAGAGGSRSVGVASAPVRGLKVTTFQVVLLFIHPFVYPLSAHPRNTELSTRLTPAVCGPSAGPAARKCEICPGSSSPGGGTGPGQWEHRAPREPGAGSALAFASGWVEDWQGVVRGAGARSAERLRGSLCCHGSCW